MTDVDTEPTAVELRRRIFEPIFDFSVGHGLEVGPLHSPIAVRGPCDVEYVDVTDRAALVEHYGPDDSVDTDLIPEIHYWLRDDDGTRSLSEAVAAGAPYDWVFASHVIEHVPDVLGWLQQLAVVLRDGGQLVLAVPDRRFTFDVFRPATSVGQVLAAHETGDETPSLRAVFDHFSDAAEMSAPDGWQGRLPEPDARLYGMEHAWDLVARQREGEYIDCHVWTFTPRELVHLVDVLGRLGLIELTITAIWPTARDTIEFYAVLERLPRDLSPADRETRRREGIELAERECPPEDVPSAAGDREREEQAGRDRERELQAVVDDLTAEVHRLRTDYHAVLVSSRWRLGGLFAAPLSRAKRVASDLATRRRT